MIKKIVPAFFFRRRSLIHEEIMKKILFKTENLLPICFVRYMELAPSAGKESTAAGGRTEPKVPKGNDVVNAVTFQAEVRRIEKLLYHIAWTHLGNDQDAEDAVQEALIKAWMKRDSLRDEKQFKPWLARILSNQCKDMLRKRKKWSFYPLKEDTAEVEMPPVENLVLEAIRKMKPEYRVLMTLYYLDGCSMRELSEITGVPQGTVKTRIRNARKQLSKTLLIEWEDEI